MCILYRGGSFGLRHNSILRTRIYADGSAKGLRGGFRGSFAAFYNSKRANSPFQAAFFFFWVHGMVSHFSMLFSLLWNHAKAVVCISLAQFGASMASGPKSALGVVC